MVGETVDGGRWDGGTSPTRPVSTSRRPAHRAIPTPRRAPRVPRRPPPSRAPCGHAAGRRVPAKLRERPLPTDPWQRGRVVRRDRSSEVLLFERGGQCRPCACEMGLGRLLGDAELVGDLSQRQPEQRRERVTCACRRGSRRIAAQRCSLSLGIEATEATSASEPRRGSARAAMMRRRTNDVDLLATTRRAYPIGSSSAPISSYRRPAAVSAS